MALGPPLTRPGCGRARPPRVTDPEAVGFYAARVLCDVVGWQDRGVIVAHAGPDGGPLVQVFLCRAHVGVLRAGPWQPVDTGLAVQ